MKRIGLVLIFGFMMFSEVGWANCDPQTAALIFQQGRTFSLTRRDFGDNSVNSGTITFAPGTDICQGTFTENSVGGTGFLTEVAGNTSGNYRVVFTYEAPDPAGREKKGAYVLASDSGATITLRLTILRKQDGNIKIFNYRRTTIYE